MLFRKYALKYFRTGLRVLEIGPDGNPSGYRKMARGETGTWHTLDITDEPGLTFPSAPEYNYPVASGAYDIVFAAQVLEHVKRIWAWIGELARVCKPGGHVITIAPASFRYHPHPVDCWRVYPEAMRALFDEAGLETALCKCESLEMPGCRWAIPGTSLVRQKWRRRFMMRTFGRLGFPVEKAYDTIAVGRKPAAADA